MTTVLAIESHRIGGKVSSGLRGHGMEKAHHRRGYATVAAGSEEVNREVRQFGVAVPGGVGHLSLRARTLHDTGN